MKNPNIKRAILSVCALFMMSFAFAQNGDALIGYYYIVDPFSGEKSQAYIYKNADGKYDGKLVWIDNKDKQNFLGMVFLKNLEYSAKKNEWINGVVEYPLKKSTYSMDVSFKDATTLKVRGYCGIALFGKTLYWKKETKKRGE